MSRSTITRRGFLASIVAAVPLLGVFIASERDTTNAQARPDTAPPIEKVMPTWHQRRDGEIRPDIAHYVAFRYIAHRRVSGKQLAGDVTDVRLRLLGFTPIWMPMPPSAVTVIIGGVRTIWYAGDTLVIYAKVNE